MNCVVLNRVGSLGLFCPIQDQGFRPSVAPLPPNMSQEPPPPPPQGGGLPCLVSSHDGAFAN